LNKLSIQWQIGNQCNFRCDYCHPDLYGGSNPFLDYERFTQGLANLEQSVGAYDAIEIEFQGGEPTISTAIRNKIVSDDTRYRYVLTTNASADLEWWTKAAPKFNKLLLAYHPDKVSDDHFKQVVDLAKQHVPDLVVVVNAPNDNRWSKAVSMYEHYKGNTPVQLKALYANYQTGNDKFLAYTQEQWDYYTLANRIEVPKEQPVEHQIQWVEQRLYNNYYGHLCWAGVNQIVIDYFGYVYRGWCHANGGFGNIFDKPVALDASPRPCPKDLCKNAFDQQSKKSENSWGMA
jgi:sulfatase maturation enzyme AslB (radical SAM superfamily)